jgi:hypothetical protein
MRHEPVRSILTSTTTAIASAIAKT